MSKKAYPSLIFLVALASCSKPPATAESGATEAKTSSADGRASGGDADSLNNANAMTCTIDNGTTVNGNGPGVGIASLGIKDNELNLALTVLEEKKGNYLRVGTGIFNFPMAPGKYESVGADYVTGNETSEKKYTSMMYLMYFATSSDDPLTKAEINIKQLEKGRQTKRLLVRTHVVGDARFYAAHAPDPITEACGNDGIKRVVNGLKYPMYNPAICGAEKVNVKCKFDITADFADLDAFMK